MGNTTEIPPTKTKTDKKYKFSAIKTPPRWLFISATDEGEFMHET